MTGPAVSTPELLKRLNRHYIRPGAQPAGGVFVSEVGMNGAWGASQRCDALYVGFTSTSGRLLVGHELKVSRADWLHELKSVGKADRWADACHEWWLVTPGQDIVQPGELPAGWGHMVVNPRTKTRLNTVVPATRRDLDPPWWAVRSVMARLDTLQGAELHAIRADARAKARADLEAEQEKTRQHRTPSALSPVDEAKLHAVRELERATGLTVTEWAHGFREDAPPEIDGRGLARLAHALGVLQRDATGINRIGQAVERITRATDDIREAQEAIADTVKVLTSSTQQGEAPCPTPTPSRPRTATA